MKYYTAFIYDPIDLGTDPHCTHKYLGTLTVGEREAVEDIISTYFNTPRMLPKVEFTEREWFGPSKNIPVLTPRVMSAHDWLLDLRTRLSIARKDDYAYNPHVTTTLPSILSPFTAYALCSGNKVLRTWR